MSPTVRRIIDQFTSCRELLIDTRPAIGVFFVMSTRSIGAFNKISSRTKCLAERVSVHQLIRAYSEASRIQEHYVLTVAVGFALRIIAIIITLHSCASAKNSRICFSSLWTIRQLADEAPKRVCTARDFSYHNFQPTRFSDILNSSPAYFLLHLQLLSSSSKKRN